MDCPRCQGDMRELPKSGVLMDVCSRCRGVFLDRGELEKIVALAGEYERDYYPEGQQRQQPYDRLPEKHYDKPYDGHYDKHQQHYHGKHKKKGFARLLGEIFD